MKKLFFISLSICAFGLMSCKKCQECTTAVTQNVLGIEQTISSVTEEYCGDQYDDAPAETSVNQDVGGVQQTVTIECNDK